MTQFVMAYQKDITLIIPYFAASDNAFLYPEGNFLIFCGVDRIIGRHLFHNRSILKRKRRKEMAQITSKELSGLSDLLTMEENLIKKYRQYACETTDTELKNSYEQVALMHQRHFDELVSNLK